ncbi:hypothetical protein P879_07492 [Paragonimus westermani]|uniref:Uncharacterized protein n=1 Tax=Paragonimus westermani TaxID=34504 RepID=A0A8T0DNB0_9TREM|nr:hypothetical protein P879_07492 [Paragonimus westermani]
MAHSVRGMGSYAVCFSETSAMSKIRSIPTNPLNSQNTSRLFQIALQATVANTDPSGTGLDGKEREHKRQSSAHSSQYRSVHLTPQQWQLLTDYHEHELFIRTRSWGFCLAIFGIGITIFGLGSPAWKWVGDGVAIITSMILYPLSAAACVRNLMEHGVIQNSVPENTDREIPHRFAYNYYLTWSASLFFIISFVCMNLDLLIQSLVRLLPSLSTFRQFVNTCRSGDKSRVTDQPSRQLHQSESGLVHPYCGSDNCNIANDSKQLPLDQSSTQVPSITLNECDEETSAIDKYHHTNTLSDDEGEWV